TLILHFLNFPPLCPPITYTHPIFVLIPPLKILYNLPLPQSSPRFKTPHLLACLDPNSLTCCGSRVNFPSRLANYGK
ncbi:unnamed protein product, partial [Hymenolepis diminuta]